MNNQYRIPDESENAFLDWYFKNGPSEVFCTPDSNEYNFFSHAPRSSKKGRVAKEFLKLNKTGVFLLNSLFVDLENKRIESVIKSLAEELQNNANKEGLAIKAKHHYQSLAIHELKERDRIDWQSIFKHIATKDPKTQRSIRNLFTNVYGINLSEMLKASALQLKHEVDIGNSSSYHLFRVSIKDANNRPARLFENDPESTSVSFAPSMESAISVAIKYIGSNPVPSPQEPAYILIRKNDNLIGICNLTIENGKYKNVSWVRLRADENNIELLNELEAKRKKYISIFDYNSLGKINAEVKKTKLRIELAKGMEEELLSQKDFVKAVYETERSMGLRLSARTHLDEDLGL